MLVSSTIEVVVVVEGDEDDASVGVVWLDLVFSKV